MIDDTNTIILSINIFLFKTHLFERVSNLPYANTEP